MPKCVGVGEQVCGVDFYDSQFPNDNVCDKCATKLEEVSNA